MTAPSYDETNIARENLSGFHKELRELVMGAVEVGWLIKYPVGKNAVCVMTSPVDSRKVLRIGPRQKPINPSIQQLRRTILKFADPVRLATAEAVVDTRDSNGKSPVRYQGIQLSGEADSRKKAREAAEEAEREARRQVRAQQQEQRQQAAPEPPEPVEQHPEPEPEPAIEEPVREEQSGEQADEPVVVEIRPLFVKLYPSKAGGKTYESDTTMERLWSDGHIDYRCKRCEWDNTSYRSVARHHGRKHPESTRDQRDADQGRDPAYIEPTYARGPSAPEEPPVWAEQESGGAEQIVQGIRELLGPDPEVPALRERVVELETELRQMEAKYESERDRADRLLSDWHALRELISSREAEE